MLPASALTNAGPAVAMMALIVFAVVPPAVTMKTPRILANPRVSAGRVTAPSVAVCCAIIPNAAAVVMLFTSSFVVVVNVLVSYIAVILEPFTFRSAKQRMGAVVENVGKLLVSDVPSSSCG